MENPWAPDDSTNLTSTQDEIKEILLNRSLEVINCYELVLMKKKQQQSRLISKLLLLGNRKLCVSKGSSGVEVKNEPWAQSSTSGIFKNPKGTRLLTSSSANLRRFTVECPSFPAPPPSPRLSAHPPCFPCALYAVVRPDQNYTRDTNSLAFQGMGNSRATRRKKWRMTQSLHVEDLQSI